MTVAVATRRAQRPPVAPPLDPVTRYATEVVQGRVVAGALVRKACQRHLDDLSNDRGLVWDVAKAERAIAFFPLLRHYKGDLGKADAGKGAPIVLEAWQEFIIGSAFGWLRPDGTRRFRSVYVEVAKKNGKTLMAAGVGILLAFFDGEPGAEVYSAATKRDQAKLVWNDAVTMVQKNPSLERRLGKTALSLFDQRTASRFSPLGRDSDTDQGINVHGAIIDELHVHSDRQIVDNIQTATAARSQPLVWKITTAGVVRESIWAEERADAVSVIEGRAADDSKFVAIYTLDEGDDPFDEAVWPKANPNLDVSVGREFLREQAAIAKRVPGKLAAYLRFHMDVGTQVSSRAIFIEEWDACAEERPIREGAECYAGLDFSESRDITALVLVFRDADGIYDVLCRFWCPERGIEQRSRLDGVPYADWVRDGYLLETPGEIIVQSFVREQILELSKQYRIAEIGYDTWHAKSVAVELEEAGATMFAIPQTSVGLAPGWAEVQRLIIERRLRHGGHPVLRWMAGNVESETDAAGNERPSKRRSAEKIDGMLALTMAISRAMSHLLEPPSGYSEERGLVTV